MLLRLQAMLPCQASLAAMLFQAMLHPPAAAPPLLAVGPMARTVEDVVRVFEAMVGPADPADPLSQLLQNVRGAHGGQGMPGCLARCQPG